MLKTINLPKRWPVLSGFLWLCSIVPIMAQTSAMAPVPIQMPLSNGGLILPGGCLYIYAAGTTNPQDTWNNSDLASNHKNTNPIVLDSFGRSPAIYQTVSLKMTLGLKSLGSCPATPGTVLWSQDNVFDAGLAVKNSLNAFIALLASSAGSAQSGFIQSQTGAVAETVQTKLRQNLNVTDFGVKCDGTTDDTAAIQVLFNDMALAGTAIQFPQNCVISSTVYLPTTSYGTVLRGTALPVFNNQAGGGNASLVAKSGSSPFTMLKIYANSVQMENFGVDCNSTASVGVMFISALISRLNHVQAANCRYGSSIDTGDGFQINATGGTVVNGTANVAISGTSTTLSSTTLQGEVFGDQSCGFVVLDYGNAQMEFLSVTSLVGSTLNFNAAAKTHTAPFPVVCKGNNNDIQFNDRHSYSNGEWGFNVLYDPGHDDNAIKDEAPVSIGNCTADLAKGLCGGSLWNGFNNYTGHGHYEGDHGVAIQLGDKLYNGSTGVGRATIGMVIHEFVDLEEVDAGGAFSAANSTIFDQCGQNSNILVADILNQFTPVLTADTCPAFAGGSIDTGFGTLITSGYNAFCQKNQNGLTCLDPPTGGMQVFDNANPPNSTGTMFLIPGGSGQWAFGTPGVTGGWDVIGCSSAGNKCSFSAYGNGRSVFAVNSFIDGGLGLDSTTDVAGRVTIGTGAPSAVAYLCLSADGKTIGYGTAAEINAGTCH